MDALTISVTGAACAIVLGLGLILYSRASRTYWWSLSRSTNAALFAASLVFTEITVAVGTLGSLTGGFV